MTQTPPPTEPTLDLTDWNKLTPKQLFGIAKRLSIVSWLFVFGLLGSACVAGFALGKSVSDGNAPSPVLALFPEAEIAAKTKSRLKQREVFSASYSDFMDWQKIQAISASIMESQPDGLDTLTEVAVSLVSQIKAHEGHAYFLSGSTQHSVALVPTADGFDLEWDEKKSLIPRIANDAGYQLDDAELALHNTNLNWAQFTYLDDEMQEAVIYRNPDGGLGLVIRN